MTPGRSLTATSCRGGFRRLTTEQRALIVLRHYLDLPLPDVAAAMDIPLG